MEKLRIYSQKNKPPRHDFSLNPWPLPYWNARSSNEVTLTIESPVASSINTENDSVFVENDDDDEENWSDLDELD